MNRELSILIPTLPARIEKLARLVTDLRTQIKKCGAENAVQIVIFGDTKEYTVGQKRNRLLEMSTGKYVCFVDDDDVVSSNYVSEILKAIRTSPQDVITFRGTYSDRGSTQPFIISKMARRNETIKGVIYRLPNHLCPVRREIALAAKFPSMNYGEDSEYANRINAIIKTEFHINQELYVYDFDPSLSQTHPQSKSNQYASRK